MNEPLVREPLARTRAVPIVPASNLRGEASGAPWTYLLPSLRLGSVLCVGRPSDAAIARLASLAEKVVVASDRPRSDDRDRWPNVHYVDPDSSAVQARFDLAWRINGRESRIGDALQRAIGSAVLRYHEARYVGLPDLSLPAGAAASAGDLILRLTPFIGEPRSAVPLGDLPTSRYFEAHGLTEQWARRRLAELRIPRVLARAALEALRLAPAPRTSRIGRLSARDGSDLNGPPRHVRDAAAGAGIDLSGYRWGMSAKGEYVTQKVLLFLFTPAATEPSIVAKQSQTEGTSRLLDRAFDSLGELAATGFTAAGRAPRPLFRHVAHNLSLIGEEAIVGEPFMGRSRGTPDCEFARDAVDGLIELSQVTAKPVAASAVSAAVAELFDRFEAAYAPSPGCRDLLRRQLSRFDAAGAVPIVFQHGDPGPQNLIVKADGSITFLDWENGDPDGLPLLDLVHFLRGYTTWATRRKRIRSRATVVRANFFRGSVFTPWIAESVARYRQAIDLGSELITPLFITGWVIGALQELPRLPAGREGGSLHARLLEELGRPGSAPALAEILGEVP